MYARTLTLLALLVTNACGRAWAQPAFCASDLRTTGRLYFDARPHLDEAIAHLRAPGGVAVCDLPAMIVIRETDTAAGVEALAAYVDRMTGADAETSGRSSQRITVGNAVNQVASRLYARLERDPKFDVRKTPEIRHLRRWLKSHGHTLIGRGQIRVQFDDAGESSDARREIMRRRREAVASAAAAALENLVGMDAVRALVERGGPGDGSRRRDAGRLTIAAARGADGIFRLEVSNSGTAAVGLGLTDESLPIAVEVQAPGGGWRTLHSPLLGRMCGTPPLPPPRVVKGGERRVFETTLPQSGTPAKLRLRLVGERWQPWVVAGAIPTTPPFDGFIHPEAAARADFRRRGQRRTVELRAMVRGQGMPLALSAHDRALAGVDALQTLGSRHDPEMETHFRTFLAWPDLEPTAGPAARPEGPLVVAVQSLCGAPRETNPSPWLGIGRDIVREILAEPSAPNRVIIARAAEKCGSLEAVLARLEHMDDPALAAFVEHTSERVKESGWLPGARALAKLAARPDAPPDTADAIRRLLAEWGEDTIRVRAALRQGIRGAAQRISLQLEVDARTERPVQSCPFAEGRACVAVTLVDAGGAEIWRATPSETRERRRDRTHAYLYTTLPDDLPDARYAFVASPAFEVAGLKTPEVRGILERKGGRWTMPEPPHDAPWSVTSPQR